VGERSRRRIRFWVADFYFGRTVFSERMRSWSMRDTSAFPEITLPMLVSGVPTRDVAPESAEAVR